MSLQHAIARHEAEHTSISYQLLARAASAAWADGEIDDDELDEILSEAANTAEPCHV